MRSTYLDGTERLHSGDSILMELHNNRDNCKEECIGKEILLMSGYYKKDDIAGYYITLKGHLGKKIAGQDHFVIECELSGKPGGKMDLWNSYRSRSDTVFVKGTIVDFDENDVLYLEDCTIVREEEISIETRRRFSDEYDLNMFGEKETDNEKKTNSIGCLIWLVLIVGYIIYRVIN